MRLELSTEEAEALREVLEEKLINLAREINRTDHFELKDALKVRERTLDRIVAALTPPPATRTFSRHVM